MKKVAFYTLGCKVNQYETDSMKAIFEKDGFIGVDFDEFEGLDIEEILDRIESLNALIKRYGSIEECLEILKKRKSELAHYENIEFQKSDLVAKFTKLSNELKSSSEAITKERFKAIKEL